MRKNNFDASPAAAASFLISQREYVEAQVYETRYPDVTYMNNIPVDTSAPEWAPIVSVMSVDIRGELEFMGPQSNDTNTVDVGYAKQSRDIATGALGYRYSLEELNEAMFIGRNLTNDKAMAANKIAEQGLNKLAYLGKASSGYEGLFNSSLVGVTPAGSTIAALVAAATDVAGAQQIVTFFQQALTRVYLTNTNTTWLPTDIGLPPAQYQLLASAILPFGGNMTVLNYLKMNLVTGSSQGVNIWPDLSLVGAGAGAVDRMVVYAKDPQVLKFHLPMGFNFREIYQEAWNSWFVPGILRTGGTEIRIPKAVQYFDGV